MSAPDCRTFDTKIFDFAVVQVLSWLLRRHRCRRVIPFIRKPYGALSFAGRRFFLRAEKKGGLGFVQGPLKGLQVGLNPACRAADLQIETADMVPLVVPNGNARRTTGKKSRGMI
jgi:hypothetical protein